MSESELNLSPTRPYLSRAIYEWICDHNLTPYILVDATQAYTDVPTQFIQDGQIVLNLAPHAVHRLNMSNDAISFSARFGGVSKDIYVPFAALMGIYARENGQGLFFDPEEYANFTAEHADAATTPVEEVEQNPVKKKPSLRILD